MHYWFWLCPLLAFASGAIPFGLIIGKSRGIDIREHGSGNIGATNVLRVLGKKYGLPCFLLDALKGFIPVVLAYNLIQIDGEAPSFRHLAILDHIATTVTAGQQFQAQLVRVITALAAVLGHTFTPFAGFKGGKGVATSGGVLLALMPAAVVILLAIWWIVFKLTRYVSLASIVAAAALPLLTHLGARFHHINNDKSLQTLWEAGTWNRPLFYFSVTIALLVILKHRTNIVRLMSGTENRFEKSAKS